MRKFSFQFFNNKTTRFDIHCHIFNKELISRRIAVSMLQEVIELLQIQAKPNDSSQELKVKRESYISKLLRIKQFLHIGFQDSSLEVFKLMKGSYPRENFIFTPLMFDLKYCFQEAYSETADLNIISSFQKQREFQTLIDMKSPLKQNIADNKPLVKFQKDKRLLSWVLKAFNKFADDLETNSYNEYRIFLNDQKSFKEQISQILDVKAKYPHNVFPFMVVDPRRPGILEMVKIFVGQGKPFAGVKLYAPNGYSPTDPLLYGKEGDTDCIYQFCIDNDLPITAHNSAGGFATFVTNLEVKGLVFKNNLVQELNGWVHFDTDFLNDGKEAIKERANTLNHPLIWAEVLKKFPTLRLDLAHFGAGDVNWSNEIFKLLSERDENNKLKYTNLHSDLSCFTKQEIEFNKTNYYDKAPADVKAKFLYGSDYYLNMIASNNFSEYYRNFISVFGQADFDKISIHNPAKYLNNKEIYKLLA